MKAAFLTLFIFSVLAIAQTNTDTHIILENDPTRIIEKISYNFETLEREYLTKLSYRDYVKAKNMLIETYDLVLSLPLPPPPGVIEEGPYPMSEEEFSQLQETIKNEVFEDDQLAVVQISSEYNYFTVSQVVRILKLFTYSSGMLKVLEYLYPNVVDKNNSHQILNAFTYSSDKDKAKEIINRN
jgi:hypothetical protein